jgi:hypothetical protein
MDCHGTIGDGLTLDQFDVQPYTVPAGAFFEKSFAYGRRSSIRCFIGTIRIDVRAVEQIYADCVCVVLARPRNIKTAVDIEKDS